MAIRLGDIAPNFTAQTTKATWIFPPWLGMVGRALSHPDDFYSLHTEIGPVAEIKASSPETQREGAAISVDPSE